jgi:acyl dehydratase
MTYRRATVVTQRAFDRFAQLSRDDNPIHVSPEFAARTRFGRTLCHGMMLCALADAFARDVFGRAPVAHELTFPGPTFAGDALDIVISPGDLRAGMREVRARITRIAGGVCMEGTLLLEADSLG